MKTIELLKDVEFDKVKDDYKFGKELCTSFFSDFNSFGDSKKKADEMLESLNEDGKKILISSFCLMMKSLAMDYKNAEQNSWDARKEASESFAYKNVKNFEEIYREYLDDYPVLTEGTEGYSLVRRLVEKSVPKCILGFFHRFLEEHPTLVQSTVRGFSNYFIENWKFEWKYPLDYDGFTFPFI